MTTKATITLIISCMPFKRKAVPFPSESLCRRWRKQRAAQAEFPQCVYDRSLPVVFLLDCSKLRRMARYCIKKEVLIIDKGAHYGRLLLKQLNKKTIRINTKYGDNQCMIGLCALLVVAI